MLRYYKTMHGEKQKEEISYEKALNILLGSFRDNDMTRDMLTIANRIQCMYSTIEVVEVDGNREFVLMAGLYNQLPMDIKYDDNGNHIVQ